MPIPTFTTNIPTANQTLGNTQQNINNNFANYFQTLSVNHAAPNSANAGKHNFVEMPVQGTDPVTLTGEGGLYTKRASPSAPSELFYRRDTQPSTYQVSGFVSTGNGALTKGGSTALFGGLILKWGQVLMSGTSQSVVFNTECGAPFPNNCFIVIVDNGGSDSAVSKTGFTLKGINAQDYNFIAIGN